LELGGNNAAVIMGDANIELAFKASIFSAVGTCG
jgi:aldehyde dehydrogenase (NAD+)